MTAEATDPKEAANKAKSFKEFDVLVTDIWYDGFCSGILADKENEYYARLIFENEAENPSFSPDKVRSVRWLHYRLFALYELSEEEWAIRPDDDAWDKLLTKLKEREPSQWAITGQYFDEKSLIEQN